MKPVVRLTSLDISNIKNVKYGRIVMPNAARKPLTYNHADVLGVYGQNGSGKTAIIDTLYFLQGIMAGLPLDRELADCIYSGASQAEFTVGFTVFAESAVYEISYRVVLQKLESHAQIARETLSCAANRDGSRSNRAVFMDYQRLGGTGVFLPKKRAEEVLSAYPDSRTDLIVARKMAEKENCSYIFGESGREIFFRDYENGFQQYSEIIRSLFWFAVKDLFVIRNAHSGVITANFFLPMAFRVEQDKIGRKGDLAVPLAGPALLDKEQRDLLGTIVEQINLVLYTIIPGMKLGIADYGPQKTDSGEDGCRAELLSVREGMQPIPIRMESDGIIKIISILNVLIQAFTNPSICLAVDELDAGIFEFLLGELLDIFHKSAKGQLIFTSHNLRALEMLDKENILFSTANPERRYIRMKNVKATNNLRDTYLRSITLGGQKEVIYEGTDSLKIARAFRKAGNFVQHD